MIVGVKKNKKFGFWVIYKNHNKKGLTDVREYFLNKEEAEKRLLELKVK
jgi:hypothetical protein